MQEKTIEETTRRFVKIMQISDQIIKNDSYSKDAKEAASNTYSVSFKALKDLGYPIEELKSGPIRLNKMQINGTEFICTVD